MSSEPKVDCLFCMKLVGPKFLPASAGPTVRIAPLVPISRSCTFRDPRDGVDLAREDRERERVVVLHRLGRGEIVEDARLAHPHRLRLRVGARPYQALLVERHAARLAGGRRPRAQPPACGPVSRRPAGYDLIALVVDVADNVTRASTVELLTAGDPEAVPLARVFQADPAPDVGSEQNQRRH